MHGKCEVREVHTLLRLPTGIFYPDGRWRPYSYDEIINRDKVSLDLFWLRDESLEDSAHLPEPHVLAREIADDLRSALGQMEEILADLEERAEQVE